MARLSYFELGKKYEKNYSVARSNLYEEHDPIYMYHISPTPLHGQDDSIVMHPKYIWSGEDEVFDIKRICVSPTIEQCLIAICPMGDIEDVFYVYRTVRKVSKSVVPYGVFDAPLTQERWLTRTRKFKLVAKIHIGDSYSSNTEILSHECGEDVPYPNYIRLDFGSRGGIYDFEHQHRELGKTRRFMRKHDKGMFLNAIDQKIHDKQRNMKLWLNRKMTDKLKVV